jgi:superoxide dismutase, Fe-Mn family
MKKFEERKFNIGKLVGISEKTVEEHLKLYSGYVKNSNMILEELDTMYKDPGKYAIEISETQRRFSFEYNGMRNHEIYFESLSDNSAPLAENGKFAKQIEDDFGSFETWFARFKNLAVTRGIGWAVLYYDRVEKRLLNTWVDEQHLGQLQDCTPILALDMWEHSFVADYAPSGKKQYIEDYFTNLNWKNVEENFSKAN